MYRKLTASLLISLGLTSASFAGLTFTNPCPTTIYFNAIGSSAFSDTVTITGSTGSIFQSSTTFTLTPSSPSASVDVDNLLHPQDLAYYVNYTVTNGSYTQSGQIQINSFGASCANAMLPVGTGFFSVTTSKLIGGINNIFATINNNSNTSTPSTYPQVTSGGSGSGNL